MTLGSTSRSLSLLFVMGVIFSTVGLSQPKDDSDTNMSYPFLRSDINKVDNYSRGLKHFYEQLCLLEEGRKRTVNIVHIGDSHIQADWFSGMVRTRMQSRFGSAGRGLVFPYKVARTNGPSDIIASSNVKWSTRRNVHSSGSMPTGVSGISLKTYSSNFVLKLKIENNGEQDYSFNKVTLFTDKGPANFDISIIGDEETAPFLKTPVITNTAAENEIHQPLTHVENTYHLVESGETLGIIAAKYKVAIAELRRMNNIEGSMIYAGQKIIVKQTSISRGNSSTEEMNSVLRGNNLSLSNFTASNTAYRTTGQFASTVYFPEMVNTLYLKGEKNKNTQSEATIYGLILENYNQSGVLYHMIGVNGARFEHYNKSEYFMQQLQVLRPDLIIISLGTNETMGNYFNTSAFFQEMDELIHSIEQYMPHANILITTPPDALRARQYPNKHIATARDIILKYSLTNDLACWNFYDVMGGNGSIQNWYRHGLAQGDRLHLTKAGYELQGSLLYDALINGYGLYRANRKY